MEYIVSILAIVVLIGVVWLLKLLFFKPFSINHFFERIMLKFALANPEILSMVRILERLGFHAHNKKLNNESEEFQRQQAAKVEGYLKDLHSYNRDKLSRGQQLSYDIMEWFLKDAVGMEEFRHHDYPVNQLFGVQNQFPTFMVSTHQINSKRDAQHYLIRLSKVPVKFRQVLEGLKIREGKGVLPPRFVYDKVLEEMQGFIDVTPEENILYKNIAEKLDNIKGISGQEKDRFLAQTKDEIHRSVYPAYQLLIDYFEEAKEKATDDAGVWKLPQGDQYYQYLLCHYTTTELTAEEIHKLGLAEVSRIQGQMQDILAQLGHTGKNTVELMQDLAQDPRFSYPDTQESRQQVLEDYQNIIDNVEEKLDPLFDIRPHAKVVVDRIPEFKEKTAPGAYYNPPAMDGSRPGVFSVNLLQLPRKYDMETLAFHEAIPGHHFQLAIQQELKGLPTFRRLIPFTAYAEGWALYTEKLAWENGFFSDNYSVLGYLASELFRAVRLVVDTGLHYKRWTREEAIEYMVRNTCSDRVSVIIEVERYIVMPGQATAYKVGELEILRLRELAREQMGAAFDIREFHNVVLKNGSMPLKILEHVVREYISSKGMERDSAEVA